MVSEGSWRDEVVQKHDFAATLDLIVKEVVSVKRLPLVEYHFVTHQDRTIFALRDDEVRPAFFNIKPGYSLLYGIRNGRYEAAFDEQGRVVYDSGRHEQHAQVGKHPPTS